MAEMDISKARVGNQKNTLEKYEVTPIDTDGATGAKETVYSFPNWTKQWGYFNEIDELRNAILMKAIWYVGKGWTANSRTDSILKAITGWGKDSFDDVLFNMVVNMSIAGDSFCEIIRGTDKLKTILNLKPLNSGSMTIKVDGKGIITGYEQFSRTDEGERHVLHKFKPNEIFHLTLNRIADQIHGLSDVDAAEDVIKAEKENFQDVKKHMHSQIRPMILWKLKTDDTAKINKFVGKVEAARSLGDDMYIPDDEDIVTHEIIQVDLSAVIFAWRQDIRNKFYRVVGVPQIVFGSAGTTESGGKMEYLAHEQVFAYRQRQLEQQIEGQLGLKVNLISPVTLIENLQADEKKDAQGALTFQPNDVTAGSGRDNENMPRAEEIPRTNEAQ